MNASFVSRKEEKSNIIVWEWTREKRRCIPNKHTKPCHWVDLGGLFFHFLLQTSIHPKEVSRAEVHAIRANFLEIIFWKGRDASLPLLGLSDSWRCFWPPWLVARNVSKSYVFSFKWLASEEWAKWGREVSLIVYLWLAEVGHATRLESFVATGMRMLYRY